MGLGMPEVVLILVIALIVFGPRKLPELGKSLGQAMAQFRRASDDFKRTWEQEVEAESYQPTASISNYSSANPDYPADSYGHETPVAAAEPEAAATVEQKPAETVEQRAAGKQQWI